MSSELKHRRGTAAAHANFTGAQGEITIKTDTNEIVVHDGATPGGWTGGGYMPAGTGAVARTVQDKLREFVSAKDFGAVGDGVADDTAALQAAFDYAVSNGLRLSLGSNTYKITSPLQVGTASPPYTPYNEASWVIEGDQKQTVSGRGCCIKLYGTGFTSAISINKGASRYGVMRGFTLEMDTKPASDVYAATYGIAFSDTFFSAFDFENIDVIGARIGFAILRSSGANGEFNRYIRCSATKCQKFFYMADDAGQAYGHSFNRCSFGAHAIGVAENQGSPEYVAFDIGHSHGGYGMHVVDFDSTIVFGRETPAANMPPTILLRNRGVSGFIKFDGGRIEGYSTLVDNRNYFSTSTVIESMDLAGVLSTPTNPLIVSSGASGVAGQYLIKECTIPVYNGGFYSGNDLGFYVLPQANDAAKYIFERCLIGAHTSGWAALPFVTRVGRKGLAEVAYKKCVIGRTIAAGENNLYILDRSHTAYSSTTTGAEFAHTSSGPMASDAGIPENLLTYPSFNGSTALSPWVHVGSTSFLVYQEYGGNVNRVSTSPSARYIQMAAGTEVYQDFKTITGYMQAAHYLAAMHVHTGNNDDYLAISLENPTTGEIYDEIRLGSATSGKILATKVSLSAVSTGATGKFRLRWKAPASNSMFVQIYLAWQLCSEYPNSGYVDSGGTPRTFSHAWDNADLFRVSGRFSLPFVARTAVNLERLPDVESDMAISSSSNRLIYFANGHGNEVPNQDVGSAAPTTGTWPAGWIRWNSAPSAGGTMGWVCVTAGTPGTWKTFGTISA